MNNNLFQWVALTAAVVGGTVYVDDDKAFGLATRTLINEHFKLHAQVAKYDDEFRAEVRRSLRDIKAQTAKD